MSLKIVTGGAGFIGCNLVRGLIRENHDVVIIDNFSTGRRENIEDILRQHGDQVQLLEGSITDLDFLLRSFHGADTVFHLAAVPSVQKSIENPSQNNLHNITGTLNMLLAARDTGVRRVIYASSSSVYGDTPTLPKKETMPPNPLSPYALSKLTGEHYCRIFTNLYGLETLSLRYFNVFGPHQDPASHYAAVIPKFINRLLNNQPPVIFGDGAQSRDFTHIDNVVRANILADQAPPAAADSVINIACGRRMDLNTLARHLNHIMGTKFDPVKDPPRPGDVKHSMADINLARDLLNFNPSVSTDKGLELTVEWYRNRERLL